MPAIHHLHRPYEGEPAISAARATPEHHARAAPEGHDAPSPPRTGRGARSPPRQCAKIVCQAAIAARLQRKVATAQSATAVKMLVVFCSIVVASTAHTRRSARSPRERRSALRQSTAKRRGPVFHVKRGDREASAVPQSGRGPVFHVKPNGRRSALRQSTAKREGASARRRVSLWRGGPSQIGPRRAYGPCEAGRQAGRDAERTHNQPQQEPRMTTTTTTKIATANLYPFLTKAQIRARLETEPGFRYEAMAILHTLQTEFEQNTKSTRDKNRQGFMSSHAVNGSRVAEKIKAGETLTPEDEAIVQKIAPRYTRQLAIWFRAKAIVEQPELQAVAALFSAGPSAS